MMKKAILSALAIMLSLSAFAQQANTLVQNNIRGKVKSLKVETYTVVNDTSKQAKHILSGSTNSTYNKLGQLTSFEELNNNDQPTYKTELSHNKEGNLAERKTTALRYNTSTVNTYIYDGKGFLVEETTKSSNGSTSKIAYKNNKQGLKVVQTGSNSNNSNVVVWQYTYDKQGNVEESRSDGGFGNRYVYDDNNRMIEESYYTPKGPNNKQEYTYDKFGNRSAEIYQGFIHKSTMTTTYSYTYDENNNWTECTKSVNGKATEVKKREYVYY